MEIIEQNNEEEVEEIEEVISESVENFEMS